jgi:hypothetical protein
MKDHTKISKFIEKIRKNRKHMRVMVLGDAVLKPHTFSLIFATFESLPLSK